MTAEIKALINAWLDVLASFLRFFGVEELDELATKIEEKIAEDDAE